MKFFSQHSPKRTKGLKPPSTKEKMQFYFQELFEGQGEIKKYLLLCTLTILSAQIPNLIKNQAARQKTDIDLPKSNVNFEVACFITSLALFLLSVIVRMKASKRLLVQFIILLLANVFGFLFIFFHTYDFLKAASIKAEPTTVMQGISLAIAGLYVTRFLDLLNPFWFFRIIPPSAYFIGCFAGSFQIKGQPTTQVTINCMMGLVSICLVIWVNSLFRWKIFTKRVENEAWNHIHKLILNKVPNPIAVLDVNGELIYTNPDFDKLSNQDIEVFSRRIINLKRRSKEAPADTAVATRMNTSFIAVNDINNTGNNHFFDQSSDEEIPNLEQLLILAREFLKQGQIQDEDYYIFDGKYDQQQSYEITISFMLECEKIILILRNTTDQARLITLENNSQYKDKLLASVSHELRTPLNGNLSLIEASLGHEAIPHDVKESYLIPAYRSGKLLLHLINDILDYSQIAAKKLRLNFEKFDIKNTIKGCYQLLELQAKRKNIDFNLIFEEDQEEISDFTTDHDRLRQIILNLLSNALKFTFKGGITLRVKTLSKKCLGIKVQDTGIGIKPEHLKNLFREFTRLDDPEQLGINTRGVGLGLTIADKLAKVLGPSDPPTTAAGIKVESQYGKGSCFSFIIEDKTVEDNPGRQDGLVLGLKNFDSDEASENLHENSFSEVPKGLTPAHFANRCSSIKSPFQRLLSEETEAPFKNESQGHTTKKLLIIDDEPFNILALESLLKGHNFLIETAYNGKEAIEKISGVATPGYDLIFMDCQMPILDGFEATKQLKVMMDTNKIPQIPIVGCTAFNSKEDINLCLEVGMSQVIKKPLSKAGVEQIIKTLI